MGKRERESRIIDAARRGDEDAWELLYRRVYPRLFVFLARRVGYVYAEDAVSETMGRAIAGIDDFRLGPAGFDGWVFGIARNVASEFQRRARRSERHSTSELTVSGYAAQEPDLIEEVLLNEERSRARRAFDALPPHERHLLELRLVVHLSAEEAAAELGMEPGAVRTAQSRALARLRRILEQHDG